MQCFGNLTHDNFRIFSRGIRNIKSDFLPFYWAVIILLIILWGWWTVVIVIAAGRIMIILVIPNWLWTIVVRSDMSFI